jgi:ribosomal protein S18 acetylase RimI-like enzyme
MTTVRAARVLPLSPDDARGIYLPFSSPFDARSLADHLRAHPSRSFWLPETGEYVIGEPWRHRAAVTTIVDCVARDNGPALVDALADRQNGIGHELIVMTDFVGTKPTAFYGNIGLGLIQEVICYELRTIPHEPPQGTLDFHRVDDANPDDLGALLHVDHAAFPWLWWNTPEEFAAYAHVPGVELYVGWESAGEPVAYIGITHFRGWGHLDRIGVVPGKQGTGYGLEALRYAVQRLALADATRIGLSTQADNTRSQRLYHRFGFTRTYQNDYNIFGRWVNAARAATALVSGGTVDEVS